MEAIQEITQHAQHLRETVGPGQPAVLNEAASIGDGVWQGDVGLELVAAVPDGCTLARRPSERDRQLAPGTTQGSRHLIRDLSTVRFYRRTDAANPLLGPCFVCKEETVVEHPVHGAVTIAKGHTVQVRYQREWDQEQRQERRNLD